VSRARFAAEPASVPGVRRFVTGRLSDWGQQRELLDDAELCVSELAANAATHTDSTSIEVALEALERGVRISVADDARTPVGSVAPRRAFPAGPPVLLDDEDTEGRGLAIVALLASDWGVEPTETGKRVWVELGVTCP
jgi:anti-sigma regulatory factor (Ser/Thr protein kinase)